MGNYKNILEFIRVEISGKINNIKHNLEYKQRRERALFNGLGIILKSLIGSLDSEDEERYNNIIEHLKENQNILQNQIDMQYSVSNSVIKNFNYTVETIKHNENILKDKILETQELVKKGFEILDGITGRDTFNELIILHNLILNTLDRIENSISFCKLHVLHPSIISSNELSEEIKRISKFYQNQLPFDANYENILDFEATIKVNCKFQKNKIIYFLEFPINSVQNYNLMYLLPIPTVVNHELFTVIPNSKFVLKDKSSIIPLTGICTQNKIYHCPNELQLHTRCPCEEEVLKNGTTKSCRYTKMQINTNHIVPVPEIKQYLIVFKEAESIEIICMDKTEVRELKGIFLIKLDDCTLNYQTNKLANFGPSIGYPFVLKNMKLAFSKTNIPTTEIEFKTYTLHEASANFAQRIRTDPAVHISPSIWTVAIYVGFLIITMIIAYKRITKLRAPPQPTSIQQPLRNVQLPEEASF